MNLSKPVRELASALGAAVGIPSLLFDDDGHAAIAFEGLPTVHLQAVEGGDEITAYVELGALSDDGREADLETLLRANFFWQATAGATLSLHGDPPVAVLAQSWSSQTTEGLALADQLKRLAAAASDWRDFIAGNGDFAGPHGSDEREFATHGMMAV